MKEDVIYRQNAINVICLSWCGCKNSDCKHHFDPEVDESYWCDGCGDVEELKNIPSAEPERKNGEWVTGEFTVESGECYCSVCETYYYAYDLMQIGESIDGIGQATLPNFCPHCGADMRGE